MTCTRLTALINVCTSARPPHYVPGRHGIGIVHIKIGQATVMGPLVMVPLYEEFDSCTG